MNSTSSDSRIGFLHLRNDYGWFYMYVYDYDSGTVLNHDFTGQRSVCSNTLYSYSTVAPAPTFTPQPEYVNQIGMRASDFNTQGNTGTHGCEHVFAIWTYLNVANEWNEVWVQPTNP